VPAPTARRLPFLVRMNLLPAAWRGRPPREGMIENRPLLTFFSHVVLAIGIAIVALPIYVTFVASTLAPDEVLQSPMPMLPGSHLIQNYAQVLLQGAGTNVTSAPVGRMMFNSLVSALVISIGKIAISLLSAFAIVYFRFPFRALAFWMIFVTLMLPVEVRILPSYKVVSDLHLIDTYAGLTLPLIASATATFLFRQFFLTIPDELAEAARIDGAGPMRFFWDVVVPLSRPNIAALFVILFIFGWNQYLWPLMITNTEAMRTVVIGLEQLIPRSGTELPTWNLIMAGAMMALLPPVAIIILMQRWFVKGLVEAEK
jgi:sn-glycerol 3-phosphate transport system permease protein